MSDTCSMAPPRPRDAAAARGGSCRPPATVVLLVLLLALPVLVGDGVAYLKARPVRADRRRRRDRAHAAGRPGGAALAGPPVLPAGRRGQLRRAVRRAGRGQGRSSASGCHRCSALVGAVVICGLVGLAFAPVAGRLRGIYLGVASLLAGVPGALARAVAVAVHRRARRADARRRRSRCSASRSPTPSPSPTLFGVAIRRSSSGSGTCSWRSPCSRTCWPAAPSAAGSAARGGRCATTRPPPPRWAWTCTRVKAAAFAISSAFAGLAGVMTRAVARPRQTRRERVHRHVLADPSRSRSWRSSSSAGSARCPARWSGP